jgi:hypothetical protein
VPTHSSSLEQPGPDIAQDAGVGDPDNEHHRRLDQARGGERAGVDRVGAEIANESADPCVPLFAARPDPRRLAAATAPINAASWRPRVRLAEPRVVTGGTTTRT